MARDAQFPKVPDSQPFCGTSGTSALSASLSIPGAEGTVDVNRGRRLDPPEANQQQANGNDSSVRPGNVVEMTRPATAAPDETVSQEDQNNGAVIQCEMVPDVPLSEYVSHFHYEPPNDSEEVIPPAEAAAAQPETSPLNPEPAALATAEADSQYFSLTGEAVAVAESADRAPLEIRVHLRRRQDLWLVALALVAIVAVGIVGWYARGKHAESAVPITSNSQASAASAATPAPASENAEKRAHQEVSAPHTVEAVKQAARSEPPTKIAQDRSNAGTALTPAVKKEASHLPNASTGQTRPVANLDSSVELANKYLKGDGVARNCDKALALLKSAAGKSNVRACNQLASMYAIGSCVQRDRVQAYHWLNAALAADPDNEWAQHNRDLMARQMTATERSAAQANR